MTDETTGAPAAPVCTHCGNDGTQGALYLAVDCLWRPALGAWELLQREDGTGSNVDCLACDGLTPDEGGALFPYGLHLHPPGARQPGGAVVAAIADGLDAAGDGRGWDAGHQRAADLANAAPDLLRHLRELVAGNYGQPGGVTVPALDPARELLATLAHIDLGQPEGGAR